MRSFMVKASVLALSVGSATADCVSDVTDLVTRNAAILFQPSDDTVKAACTPPPTGLSQAEQMKIDTKAIVDACGGEVGDFKFLFNLMDDILCETGDTSNSYCVVPLLSIVPFAEIAVAAQKDNFDIASALGAIDYSSALVGPNNKLDKICPSLKCGRKLINKAVKTLKGEGIEQSTRDLVSEIIRNIEKSCQTDENGKRCLEHDFFTDLTKGGLTLNEASICSGNNNGMHPCVKQVLGANFYMDGMTTGMSDIVKAGEKVCNNLDKPPSKIGKLKMKLKNALFSYYLENKAEIDNILKTDLCFSIPGLFKDDIVITCSAETDDSVVCEVEIAGEEILKKEIDVMALVEALAAHDFTVEDEAVGIFPACASLLDLAAGQVNPNLASLCQNMELTDAERDATNPAGGDSDTVDDSGSAGRAAGAVVPAMVLTATILTF